MTVGTLGIGIMNSTVFHLHPRAKALLLKNLDKFYNKHDIPWVNLIWESYYSNQNLPDNINVGSFWWKSHLKLLDLYKGMASCNAGVAQQFCSGLTFGKMFVFTKRSPTW
jgi:hypothetical protein